MDKKPKYVKFTNLEAWQKIRDAADQLARERGANVSMTDYISEAAKFFEDKRFKPESVEVTVGQENSDA